MICPLSRRYFLQTFQFEVKLYTWILYRNIEQNLSIVSVRKCLDDLRQNNRCKWKKVCRCYWSSENRLNSVKEASSFSPGSDINESHNSSSRFQWRCAVPVAKWCGTWWCVAVYICLIYRQKQQKEIDCATLYRYKEYVSCIDLLYALSVKQFTFFNEILKS
jgi:hypothetical protein